MNIRSLGGWYIQCTRVRQGMPHLQKVLAIGFLFVVVASGVTTDYWSINNVGQTVSSQG